MNRRGAGLAFVVTTLLLSACSAATGPGDDPCQRPSPIGTGAHNGSLASGDCVLSDGTYADAWALSLSRAATVDLTLASDEFRPFLFVRDGSATVRGEHDPGAVGRPARVTETLAPGSYVVWVNGLPGSEGEYRLSAKLCELPPIGLGESVAATLSAGDCAHRLVGFVEGWSLELTDTTDLQIRMEDAAFPALTLTDASLDTVATGAGVSSLHITGTMPPGPYQILVGAGTVPPNVTYPVSYRVSASRCEPGLIELGETVSGTLSRSDCKSVLFGTFLQGFIDRWTLTLRDATTVLIEMGSDLSTSDGSRMRGELSVRSGSVLVAEASSAGGFGNAVISETLATGTYTVAVGTSSSLEARGSYELSVRTTSGAVR